MSYQYNNRCRKACGRCLVCGHLNYNRWQEGGRQNPYGFCVDSCTQCNDCYFDNAYAVNTESTKPWFQYLGGGGGEPQQVIHYRPYAPWNIYRYNKSWRCEDVCDPERCKQFYKKLKDYRGCRKCQLQNPPKCWCPEREKCVDCPEREARADCLDKYGCKNPRGFPHRRVRPENPIYTRCKLCW